MFFCGKQIGPFYVEKRHFIASLVSIFPEELNKVLKKSPSSESVTDNFIEIPEVDVFYIASL